MASEWQVSFEDPKTREEVTVTASRPLRQDELSSYMQTRFGGEAKILRRDPYPGTTRQFQEVLAGKPTAAPERWSSRAEGWQERLKADAPEIAGLVAGTTIGMGAPSLLTRLGTAAVTRGVLPNIPRLGQLLGLTASSTAAGATQPLVAGRPEDIESGAYFGATTGGLTGALTLGKGALSRAAPGGPRRAGGVMAKDIERVGGTQVPPLKGINTAEGLYDWATSMAGQEGLNKMYGAMKDEIKAAIAVGKPAPTGYKALIAKKLGTRAGDLNVPAISNKPMSFDKALEEIKTLGRSFEAPATGAGVQESRHAWMEAMDQLYGELTRLGVPKDVQARLAQVKAQYARALAYRILLEESFTQRTLAPVLVQKALADNRALVEKLMGWAKGPKEYNALADILLRGKMGKDPVTGGQVPAVGKMDIPGLGFSRHFRGYAIQGPTGLPTKFRLGTALPNQPWWTKYQAAPGRLPLEIKPENRDLINRIMQLSRGGVQVEFGE